MPAATNNADLLAVFDKDLQKLHATLAKIDEDNANLAAPDDEVSIKGIIAHRIHWIGMFHTWYEDGVAGRTVYVPAKGYKWNQLKAYNASLYAAGDRMKWDEARRAFDKAAAKLRAFIADRDDDELYGQGVYEWTGKWTLGRFAEASGPSHFRSAGTYIRKALKAAG
ncbi:MAG: ClbS/DfsB family four-helix bundle protein [Pseudomonadota bacterium]